MRLLIYRKDEENPRCLIPYEIKEINRVIYKEGVSRVVVEAYDKKYYYIKFKNDNEAITFCELITHDGFRSVFEENIKEIKWS
jgi:hypothetical protein